MNKSLPWSVKTLHLDVCKLDITEPSSILRKPVISAPSVCFSDFSSIDVSFAKTGLAFIPKIMAGCILKQLEKKH